MKSVALRNLGCKVNAYEMDVMQQMLQEKGYIIVPFDEIADIYIVNTCTVTNIADRKSRQMLHQAKQRNPKAVVVAVGCYVQTGGEKALLDESIDLAVGNNRKKDLVSILEAFLQEREISTDFAGRKTINDTSVIDINAECDYEEMSLRHTAGHTRAYIKIQDGCNQFCSYCIIPLARGRVRSRRWEDIWDEMVRLAAEGYKEIVLTGIHISSYGIDFDEAAWQQGESVTARRQDAGRDYGNSAKLFDLLQRIHGIEGIERIRIGSLEPRIITEETAKQMAALPKLCPHFHLSLQSGCDETLKRMNRHYTTGEYWKCVEYLRQVYEHPAITTDVIVGFPGETEEEFEKTYAFLEKIGFYEMHIFKYSKRKGTRAEKLPGQVPSSSMAKRSDRLFELERIHSEAFRAAYIGKEETVLFEETKEFDGILYWIGHTGQYVRVAKRAEQDLQNHMITGRITGFLTPELLFME